MGDGYQPGPASETGQALNFIVTNNNTPLFSVQPAIAVNRTLTYAGSTPTAPPRATVQLHDATAAPPAAAWTPSAAQTFTITVAAVNDVPGFTKGANQSVVKDAGRRPSRHGRRRSAGPGG